MVRELGLELAPRIHRVLGAHSWVRKSLGISMDGEQTSMLG